MSKFTVVTVRDSAAGVYSSPQFVAAPAQAVRGFSDQINSGEQSVVRSHPEDFELYDLGVYDDEDGSFTCHPPELIVRGKDLIRSKE